MNVKNCFRMLSFAAFLAGSPAMASDLICHGAYLDQADPSHSIPVAGQPEVAHPSTRYQLDISVAGVGSARIKLNAVLTATSLYPNGASQVTVKPIASLVSGESEAALTRYDDGRRITAALWLGRNQVFGGIDEAAVKAMAGKSGEINIGVAPMNLARGLPFAVGEINQVFCVVF